MTATHRTFNLKISTLLWDEAERQGYRNIKVSIDSNNIFSVVSHKTNNVWCSSIIPLGFRQNKEDVSVIQEFYSIANELLQYLESENITLEKIQNYLEVNYAKHQ